MVPGAHGMGSILGGIWVWSIGVRGEGFGQTPHKLCLLLDPVGENKV